MPLSVALTHRTTYRYDRAVTLGPQTIRLRPAPHARTPVLSYALRVEPQAAFHQLAAGPAGQSPRPRGVPRARHAFRRHGRSRRRHGDDQSVRLLPRAGGRDLAVQLRPGARAGAGAVPPAGAGGAAAAGAARPGAARRAAHRGHAGGAQPHGAEPRRLHRPHGARRLDAGGDAGGGQGLLPRLGLAAGAVAAPARLRGALRLRLPDPARRRREAAGRAGRPDRRLHRPARLGGGLSAGRRLGRPRRHLGTADRRGPHPARRHARPAVRRADHRPGRAMRDRVRLRHAADAHARDAARHQAVHARRSGRTSWRWARRWTGRSPPATCG